MSKEEKINVEEEAVTPPFVPKKRKKKWPLFMIILILIVGLVFFFRRPILNGMSKIPVIGDFIPVSQDETEESLSEEELRIKVKSQAQEIEQLNNKIENLQDSNEALTDKNKSLQQYETMYNDFMNQKAAWDEEIARTNTDLFIEQFESVYPDEAERIYQSIKSERILSDKQRELSNTIGQMDEEQAAGALEQLISTDPELIQSIFEGMSSDRKALILSSMSAQSAAQVIKLISPDE